MAPQQRRLVILANSRKGGSRCVAGIEVRNRRAHDWIRPVDSAHGTVANYYRQYEGGDEPALGDVLMSLSGRENRNDHQRENWWLDTSFRWRRDGKLTWAQLCTLSISDDPLWPDEQAGDSGFGLDNRVRFSRAQGLTTSLRLIRVKELQVEVVRGHRDRFDGTFRLAGKRYRLGITDPVYEQMYGNSSSGSYSLGECLLTISLGAPFAGFCYKLIAGIIERNRYAGD